mmetsp:Transcript_97694/g.203876  ORF Transcript_97694/g.203876 Transcript_97694/m.203876 type:complete len:997 (+) Transcript_97694:85-3075(+)
MDPASSAEIVPSSLEGIDDLYTTRECLWLVLYWLIAWFFLHILSWPIWNLFRVRCLPLQERERYLHRLCRSQVYCGISTVASVYLLSQCGWNAIDLLHKFSRDHQIFFTMAVAHWMLSIWEDMNCINFLNAGMDQDAIRVDANLFLAQAYLVHHVVAGCGFLAITLSQGCTGIGAFGLLYEFPVLIMNHREFSVLQNPRPRWMMNKGSLLEYWQRYKWMFIIGRGVPSIVYIYSLLWWRDDLFSVSFGEGLLYHFMAIFFTLLNYQLINVLNGWYSSDIRRVERQDIEQHQSKAIAEDPSLKDSIMLMKNAAAAGADQIDENAPLVGDEEDGEEEEQPREIGPSEAPSTQLKEVPEDMFYKENGAEYAPGVVWIEIDGIAYDVSGFVSSHPGGAATLERFGGRDATEAFHRTRHSLKAKLMMRKFAVGAIIKREEKYRIFEQRQIYAMLGQGRSILISALLAGLGIQYTVFGVHVAELPAGSSMVAFLTPGLVMSVLLTFVSIAPQFFSSPMTFLVYTSWSVYACGLSIPLLCCGILLTKRPRPDGFGWYAPTGVEFSVLFMFLFEELRELCLGAKYWTWHIFIGLFFCLYGFYQREALEVIKATPEELVGAILFAMGTYLMAHRSGDRGIEASEGVQKADLAVGVFYAGCISLIVLMTMHLFFPNGQEVQESISKMWRASWWATLLSAPGITGLVMAASQYADKGVRNSPTWIVRVFANMMGACNGLSAGFSHYYWCMWVAWFANNAAVAIRHRKHHDAEVANGNFHNLPYHVVGTRGIWDVFRAACSALCWMLVQVPMRALVNRILPEELAVHSLGLPIFDLGEVVNYGVCAYHSPKHSQLYKIAPRHFEIAVRNVDSSSPSQVRDARAAAHSLREAWFDLKKDKVQGLLAEMVCLMPNVGGTKTTKEVRLNCWHTEEDALRYRQQKKVLNDSMTTIPGEQGSGTETCLKPTCEIQHQDRCRDCFRLIQSAKMGNRAPKLCTACNGKGYGYPFF